MAVRRPSIASQRPGVSRVALRLAIDRRDDGEKLGVVDELGGVLEGQPGGPRSVSLDDEGCDLDQLPCPPCCRAGLVLCSGEVVGCSGGVAISGGHHRQQGVFDSERSHGQIVRHAAEVGLTSG